MYYWEGARSALCELWLQSIYKSGLFDYITYLFSFASIELKVGHTYTMLELCFWHYPYTYM